MAGSTYGTIFKITTWGESHGKALGVVIDGCPAGLSLSEEDIQIYLDRRKPGRTSISTPRKEDDQVEILSGVFEGKTTGTPISLMVRNTSQKSSDYSQIASVYRPGHADYPFDAKYGFRDYRGGGRSSGRETIGRVAAGAVATKILSSLGVEICAYTEAIGPVAIDYDKFDKQNILSTQTCMPDAAASAKAENYLKECQMEKDSSGGVIACLVTGLPAGIGEPVFEKLDASLAKAILSIGAVKAFEIGDGILAAKKKGSENNDAFVIENGKIHKKTNHSGGTLGGMSDGSDLFFKVHVKPTPSIFQPQDTVNRDGENVTIQIKGRHDPVIVPRAVVVVEAMASLTILDLMMLNMNARIEYLEKFYRN